MENLKNRWHLLLNKHSSNEELISKWWEELVEQYGQENRAYHNLQHLKAMFAELEKFKSAIDEVDLLQFSIFYHDIIYSGVRKDNEKKSAIKAREILTQLDWPEEKISQCFDQIMITQKHEVNQETSNDERLLIDFDLEVLSRPWDDYKLYCQQIRQEYWMYPDFMYKKGRKAALQHFLERPQIYQTDFYQKNKELPARENIGREIKELL